MCCSLSSEYCLSFTYTLISVLPISLFFFFNDTATTEIYTLSLHDALPICSTTSISSSLRSSSIIACRVSPSRMLSEVGRSEEHTSELQSLAYLVCRLLLEKKKLAFSSGPPNHAPLTSGFRPYAYITIALRH